MRKRIGKNMHIKGSFLIGCILAGSLMSGGCLAQTGYGSENIQILSEKSTGEAANTASESVLLKSSLEVPDQWEVNLQSRDKKNTLEMKAKISVPEVICIPERKINPRSYTQEEVDEIIKNIFPDGKLYDYHEYDSEEKQKKRGFVKEKEVSTKFEDSIDNRDISYSSDGESKEAEEHSLLGGENIAYNGKIYDIHFTDYERLTKASYKEVFMYYPYAISLERVDFSPDPKYDWTERTESEVKKDGYPLPDLSQEEALKLAGEGLEKCHLDQYELWSSAYTLRGKGKENKKQAAYFFRFVKSVGGVPIAEAGEDTGSDVKKDTFFSWSKEGAIVIVDEDGISELIAGSDGQVGKSEKVNALLPFPEIENIAEKALLKTDGDEESRTISVDHIELAYLRRWNQEEQDDAALEGTLKPYWIFYGKKTSRQNTKETVIESGNRNLQLAVNAATGEIMEFSVNHHNV